MSLQRKCCHGCSIKFLTIRAIYSQNIEREIWRNLRGGEQTRNSKLVVKLNYELQSASEAREREACINCLYKFQFLTFEMHSWHFSYWKNEKDETPLARRFMILDCKKKLRERKIVSSGWLKRISINWHEKAKRKRTKKSPQILSLTDQIFTLANFIITMADY